MTRKNDLEFSEQEIQRLLHDMESFNPQNIEPLSPDEIETIGRNSDAPRISAERHSRQKQFLEDLRQEWVEEEEKIDSLFSLAKSKGLSQSELARRLRLTPEILLMLDVKMLLDLPAKLFHLISTVLDVSIRSIYIYLTSSSENRLPQVAARSLNRPAAGENQIWGAIIEKSTLPEEEKAYWLSKS